MLIRWLIWLLSIVDCLLLVNKERVDVAILGESVTIRYRLYNPLEVEAKGIKLTDGSFQKEIPLLASKQTLLFERIMIPQALGPLEDQPALVNFVHGGKPITLHSSFRPPLRVISREAWQREMESHPLAWTIWWTLAAASVFLLPRL